MVRFTKEQLKQLVSAGKPPCVSIFLPTHMAGRDVRQDPIRLKNLLHKAEEALHTLGTSSTDASKMIKPAQKLLNDNDFWQHSEFGLVIYLSEGFHRIYRVPIELQEEVIVNERFAVKPILPLLTEDRYFYVLALSQKATRLLECTKHTLKHIPLPSDIATSLEEAVGLPPHRKHVAYPSSVPHQGAYTAHSEGTDNEHIVQENLRFFLRQINDGVKQVISDEHAPLVVAAADPVGPLFEKISTIKGLVPEVLHGNHDHVANDELKHKALKIIERAADEEIRHAVDRFGIAISQSMASYRLPEIIEAAKAGRVDTLFVAKEASVYGKDVDHIHDKNLPGDTDLLDVAAVQTLMANGHVLTVDQNTVPEHAPAAAIYRY